MVGTLASGPGCPGLNSQCSQKIVDGADVSRRRCLEESGQWLENVDRSLLVLASGKLATKK